MWQKRPRERDQRIGLETQEIALQFSVIFGNASLFTKMRQKRPTEGDQRIGLETQEMTLQM